MERWYENRCAHRSTPGCTGSCRERARCRRPARQPRAGSSARWRPVAAWVPDLSCEDNGPAWEIFVRRYGAWLHRRCWYSLRRRCSSDPDWEEVKELVQDIYCRLLENRRRLLRAFHGDTDQAWKNFLCRVVRSVVIDHLRHRRALKRGWAQSHKAEIRGPESGELAELTELLPAPTPSPERRVQMKQGRRILFDRCRQVAGSRSPQRNARILWLALLEGWSSREISTVVSLSPSAIDSVVHRARRQLEHEGLLVPSRE